MSRNSFIATFGDLVTKPSARKRTPGFTTTKQPGSAHSQSSSVLLAPPVRPIPAPPPPIQAVPARVVPEAVQETPLRLPQQVTPSATELEAIAQVLAIYARQLAPGPIARELLASEPNKPIQRHVRDRLEALAQARRHINQAATLLLGLCQL